MVSASTMSVVFLGSINQCLIALGAAITTLAFGFLLLTEPLAKKCREYRTRVEKIRNARCLLLHRRLLHCADPTMASIDLSRSERYMTVSDILGDP